MNEALDLLRVCPSDRHICAWFVYFPFCLLKSTDMERSHCRPKNKTKIAVKDKAQVASIFLVVGIFKTRTNLNFCPALNALSTPVKYEIKINLYVVRHLIFVLFWTVRKKAPSKINTHILTTMQTLILFVSVTQRLCAFASYVSISFTPTK